MENLAPPVNELALESVETKQPEPIAPEGTAPAAEDQNKEQVKEKLFTQAELDALIQKRLLKEERRVHRRVEQQLREEAQRSAPAPRREDFQNDQAYLQAQVLQLAEQKAAELLEKRERERETAKQNDSFEERAEKVAEKYPDFDAVVKNPSLPISDSMAEYIRLSDQGPDVAYHLGKNPGEAARIAQLTPVAAARELARIEGELAAKPKARLSNAPEPITPVGNRGRASTSASPSDDDDIDTWMRKERDRLAKRR